MNKNSRGLTFRVFILREKYKKILKMYRSQIK